MTKKAKRRQIMEAVGYPDKRVEYLSEDHFTYKRDGELLKEELKKILEYLNHWQVTFGNHHKRAWRSHIRDACGIEYNSQMGWEEFTKLDLNEIWREVAFCDEHDVMYDEEQEEFYCPVCEQ